MIGVYGLKFVYYIDGAYEKEQCHNNWSGFIECNYAICTLLVIGKSSICNSKSKY